MLVVGGCRDCGGVGELMVVATAASAAVVVVVVLMTLVLVAVVDVIMAGVVLFFAMAVSPAVVATAGIACLVPFVSYVPFVPSTVYPHRDFLVYLFSNAFPARHCSHGVQDSSCRAVLWLLLHASCLVLSCMGRSCPIASRPVACRLVAFNFLWYCFTCCPIASLNSLSCACFLSCFALFCPVLLCPVLSCPVALSCPVLIRCAVPWPVRPPFPVLSCRVPFPALSAPSCRSVPVRFVPIPSRPVRTRHIILYPALPCRLVCRGTSDLRVPE